MATTLQYLYSCKHYGISQRTSHVLEKQFLDDDDIVAPFFHVNTNGIFQRTSHVPENNHIFETYHSERTQINSTS